MDNKIIKIVFACCLGIIVPGYAQQVATQMSGTVKDAYGEPLPGVIISSADGKSLGTTDFDGAFSVETDANDPVLSFSLFGYKKTTKKVDGKVDVVLEEDAHLLGETIYMGQSTQSRETFAGSASTVKGSTLEKSLYSRLQGTMMGRLSGLTTIESSSQPGSEEVDMYIRGLSTMHGSSAGIVIDGIYYDNYAHDLLYRISPMDVESITVLKDGASQALYGIQGARGVIVITTKRGVKGKPKVDVMVDEIIQQPTTTPTFINSATYATLRNLAASNDGLGSNYYFTDEQIAKFQAGDDPNYPNNNWRKMLMRNLSQMQRAGVSVTGGSDKVQYYTNVNFTHQGSFWKTDQTEYSSDNNLYKVNIRANVDVQLNKYLSAYLNMAGNIVRRHDPYGNTQSGNNSIYQALFTLPPTVYGPVTPATYDDEGNVVDPGGEVTVTENTTSSPYGMLNRSGYYNQTNTNIYSQFGLNLDLSFLTPGLSVSGKVGYLSYTTASMGTTQSYARYRRTDDLDALEFVQQGTTENTELSYSKSTAVYGYLSYRGAVDYARNFGLHHVAATMFGTYQSFTLNSASYNYNRLMSGLEVQYDFDNRYALKVDLGYSGSDLYARGHRYIWTPGFSVAYIMSNEDYIKNNAPWLTLLKPRFTYALTANESGSRYDTIDKVSFSQSGLIGYLGNYLTSESSYGNPSLEAEKIRKMNIGLDLGFMNQLTLSVDLFKERTINGVVSSTEEIPEYGGRTLSSLPSTNIAEYENKGYEIELNYMKRLNKDWTINLGGFVAYNKNKIIYTGESTRGDDYAYPYREEGFAYGQTFGYLVDYSNGNGMFNFQNEIDNSGLTYEFGTPRVGDLIYQDLNGDGVINEEDQAPIGNGSLPRYYYGISGGFSYKNFELSFLLQGVGKYSSVLSGIGVYETSNEGVFSELHLKSWTEERWNNDEEILYPALSTTTSTNHQTSDFFLYNRSYLRLRNLEVAYTLPKHISRIVQAKTLKVILSGQNLFTIHHMKTNDFGPEGTYSSFPAYRMYSIGVRAQF